MTIAIVNDLPIAAEALRRALAATPHQMLWVARDGAEAVDRCARETPDLILMDLLMPRMNGVEATRRIMSATPCAIVIVTASVGANASLVYQALGHGALDAVDTPEIGSGDAARSAAALLAKIETIRRLIGQGKLGSRAVEREPVRRKALVAIGASAGGPTAVATILSGLPPDFDAAIVVVQHVDEAFTSGMASWLNAYSPLVVRIAKEGDTPSAGTVLLAATNDHLVFKTETTLGYALEPAGYVYRPSIDVFFNSVGRFWRGDAIGVLLTGMGRDGAFGLKSLRDDGYHTIAQDRQTSAVYGMPKAAASLGAAIDILPLESIAPRLTALRREAATIGGVA